MPDHETLVWLAKSVGLIYLMLLSIIVTIYACWPSNRSAFDRAAVSVLEKEDKPWR